MVLRPVKSQESQLKILGPQRALYLNHRPPPSDDDGGVAPQRAALRKQLDQLGRAQINLIATGGLRADRRRRHRHRMARRCIRPDRGGTPRSGPLDKELVDQGGGNTALLELQPEGAIDPTLLSEEEQRDLYDASICSCVTTDPNTR
jgi:hypothetical protein